MDVMAYPLPTLTLLLLTVYTGLSLIYRLHG